MRWLDRFQVIIACENWPLTLTPTLTPTITTCENFTTCYALLATYYLLPTTYYLLLTTHHLPQVTIAYENYADFKHDILQRVLEQACMYHAHAVHTPRTCHAHAMHHAFAMHIYARAMHYAHTTHHAHAMHTPRTRHAHATPMPRPCHAHAIHIYYMHMLSSRSRPRRAA